MANIQIDGYHGTSETAAKAILSTNSFFHSQKDNEWAGSGVYFFICDDEDDNSNSKLVENARYWAIRKKRFNRACILKATIVMDSGDVLNVRKEPFRSQFHKWREYLYCAAVDKAHLDGVSIKKKYLSSMSLDCETINSMCQDQRYLAVIRDAYIKQLNQPNWPSDDYPFSTIPNCTILCIRDSKIITEIKII